MCEAKIDFPVNTKSLYHDLRVTSHVVFIKNYKVGLL